MGVAAVTVEAAVTVAGAETVLQAKEAALGGGLKDPPDPLALEEVMAGADEARVAQGDLEDLAGAWEGWVVMVPMVTVLGTVPAAVTVTATVAGEEGAGADEAKADQVDPEVL